VLASRTATLPGAPATHARRVAKHDTESLLACFGKALLPGEVTGVAADDSCRAARSLKAGLGGGRQAGLQRTRHMLLMGEASSRLKAWLHGPSAGWLVDAEERGTKCGQLHPRCAAAHYRLAGTAHVYTHRASRNLAGPASAGVCQYRAGVTERALAVVLVAPAG
jgi:hypothetical protein